LFDTSKNYLYLFKQSLRFSNLRFNIQQQKKRYMKKIILLTVLVTSFSAAYCQYFTVKLGGGYSWGGLQQSTGVLTFQPGASTDPAYANIIPLANFSTAVADSPSAKYKSNLYAAYGRGAHIDFSFGYMFNPYFGVQLDGAYLWGATVTANQLYDAAEPLGNSTSIVTRTHSNGLSVNPSLVFRAAKAGAKFAPYARVGLALPIAGAIYHTLDISAPNSPLGAGGPVEAEIGVKTEANVSLGFQGAAGVSYTPFPLMTFWGEVNGQYLFVRAKQSTLTEYNLTTQGKTSNLLPSLSTYSKVTNFVDQLNVNSNAEDFGKQRATSNMTLSGTPGYVNENAGHDELRQVANLGAFGFTVGVTFNLSKKIFKDPFGKKAKADMAK
jgi:hypothetical protein